MCVIAVCQKRRLTRDEAKDMWLANPNGAGVAWRENGELVYRKGFMTRVEFEDFYFGRKLPLSHIVHFRIATHGGISAALTHPYICSDRSELPLLYKGSSELLFHNGMYKDCDTALNILGANHGVENFGDEPMSDTRVLALIQFHTPEKLKKALGLSNKVAILRKKTILLLGQFTSHNGVHFSNENFRYKAKLRATTPILPTIASSIYWTPSNEAEYDFYTPQPHLVMPARKKVEPKMRFGNVFGQVKYGK